MISSLNRVLARLWLAACFACFAYPAVSAEAPPPAAPPGNEPQVPAEGGTVNPFTPVQSQSLGQVDAKLIGLIDQSSGGFAPDLWSGTNRLVVETVLPGLPVATNSPTLTQLGRRLLLSKAQPPPGATRGISLLAVRLERVLAIGQVGAVETMAAQVPAELNAPGVLAARVDALLYQSNDEEACTLAERARGNTRDSAAWTKRLAYCSALAGKVAEARLASDVLGDTGDQDQGFAQLIAKLVDKAKLKSVLVGAPSAVHFALLRKTATPLEDASLSSADLAFLNAWSAYDKAPLGQRIVAAERAVSAGALSVETLALYAQVKLKPELVAAPFDPETMPAAVAGAAFVVQRLAMTDDVAERGHLVAAALIASKARGTLPGVAAALRAQLTTLDPVPALADVAPTLGMGAVMVGDDAAAKRWLDLIKAQGEAETEPGQALRSLLAVRGDVADVAWTPETFLVRINSAAPANKPRAALEWALLRALGTAYSEPVWLATLEAPTAQSAALPTPPIMEGLRVAAAQGRVGETVMFTLVALGDRGVRNAHPTPLTAVIAALARVGLTSDARALAAESLAWQMP